MSACYVFVFFLVFADLCCKCSFTRMLWFFEYYEACTLQIKDFVWLTLLRRCGKINTSHLYFNSLCGSFWWFTVSGQTHPLDYRCTLIAAAFCGLIADCPLGLPHSLKYGGETSAERSQSKWHLNLFLFLIVSFTILSGFFFSIGLASKFVQVFPQDVTGKPKQTLASPGLAVWHSVSLFMTVNTPARALKTHTRWLALYLLCPLWLNRWVCLVVKGWRQLDWATARGGEAGGLSGEGGCVHMLVPKASPWGVLVILLLISGNCSTWGITEYSGKVLKQSGIWGWKRGCPGLKPVLCAGAFWKLVSWMTCFYTIFFFFLKEKDLLWKEKQVLIMFSEWILFTVPNG